MRLKLPGLCNYWWDGEYPGDGPVEHECYLNPGHDGLHTCGCGDQSADSSDPCPEWNCPDLSVEDRRDGKTCPDHPCTCPSEGEL